MTPENLLKQIEFIKEIDKIKYISRRTKLINSDRNENDAEHSWMHDNPFVIEIVDKFIGVKK